MPDKKQETTSQEVTVSVNQKQKPQGEKVSVNINNPKFYTIALVIACASLIIVALPYILNFISSGISDNPNDWASLGSYYGGLLSPILSFLTIFYVARTFRLQMESMQLDRQQFYEERTRYDEERKEEQKRYLADSFTNQFFKLLDYKKDAEKSLIGSNGKKGNEVISNSIQAHETLISTNSSDIQKAYIDIKNSDAPDLSFYIRGIIEVFESNIYYFQQSSLALYHYIKNIENIYRFITDSTFIENKDFYFTIFSSQLSNNDKKIIKYYNNEDYINKVNFLSEFFLAIHFSFNEYDYCTKCSKINSLLDLYFRHIKEVP